jgi:hypothetical protein
MNGLMLDRRTFLTAGVLAALGASRPALATDPEGVVFVPAWGIWRRLMEQGGPAADAEATRWAERLRLPTGLISAVFRLEPARGEAVRRLLPVSGHAVVLSPDRRRLLVAPMEQRAWFVLDAETLEIEGEPLVLPEGFVGGGHAAFLPGGEMLTVERRPQRAFTGREADHEGRLVVRDPATRRPLLEMTAGGMAPHDVALLPDGRAVAVACCGSINPNPVRLPDGSFRRSPPQVLASRVAVVELASGRVLETFTSPDADAEMRHLAVHGRRLVVAQTRMGMAEHPEAGLRVDGSLPYPQEDREVVYLPATPLQGRLGTGGGMLSRIRGFAPAETVHALSLAADPVHGEVLVTIPAANRVAVVDAADGALKRLIDVAPLGCRHPCGVGLLDARTWVVAGHAGGLFAFERGTHEPRADLRMDVDLAGHSHLLAA